MDPEGMKSLILTITLMIVSQAEAGTVTTTCKEWKEPPVIKEYNGKSYAVGQAMCKVWDTHIVLNRTHGLQPTEVFCLYTKRDDPQACFEDGRYGLFDSFQFKQQAIATKAAYKIYLAEKEKSGQPKPSDAPTVTATAGQ